jgi:hypothetical protein
MQENHMLDFKTQSQLVDATATIMRAYFRAATNTMAAASGRSFSLWTEMVEAGKARQTAAAQQGEAKTEPVKALWPLPVDLNAAKLLADPMSAWSWGSSGAPGATWTPLAQAWWLGPSVRFWSPLANWGAWVPGSLSGWNGALQVPPAQQAASPSAKATPDFAAYRSAGGHASTQVIVPELVEMTAKAALSPMHVMLGVWGAAFRH